MFVTVLYKHSLVKSQQQFKHTRMNLVRPNRNETANATNYLVKRQCLDLTGLTFAKPSWLAEDINRLPGSDRKRERERDKEPGV